MLFLSHIQPHRPVTSQRIAHWVKNQLSEVEVDTSWFNSVRGAVTSAALNKGVTLGDILQVANWSSDSTFRSHPTHDHSANYGQEVLQVTQLGEEMLHLYWSHSPACSLILYGALNSTSVTYSESSEM